VRKWRGGCVCEVVVLSFSSSQGDANVDGWQVDRLGGRTLFSIWVRSWDSGQKKRWIWTWTWTMEINCCDEVWFSGLGVGFWFGVN
jgi:hypothetical protein